MHAHTQTPQQGQQEANSSWTFQSDRPLKCSVPSGGVSGNLSLGILG